MIGKRIGGDFRKFAFAQVNKVYVELSADPKYSELSVDSEHLITQIDCYLKRWGRDALLLTNELSAVRMALTDKVALAAYRRGWLDALESMSEDCRPVNEQEVKS